MNRQVMVSRSLLVKRLALLSLLTFFGSMIFFFVTSRNTQVIQTDSTSVYSKKTAQASKINTTSRTAALIITPAPSSITVTASPTAVRLQDKSTLSGTLTSTDTSTDPPGPTTPLPNQPIEIQVKTGTDTWAAVANGTTDANGAFSVPVTITKDSSEFRAVFAGDAAYAASQSSGVAVTGFQAITKLSLTSPTKLTAEQSVTYSAHFSVYDSRMTTKPPIIGAAVDVYRKDAYGGDWKRVTTITTNTSGNVSWKATVSTPTYWKLTGHSTSNSLPDTFGPYKPTVVPSGKGFKLPSSAPKPKALAPQPGAVGTGAHPAVSSIPDAVWKNMVGKSWHSGCPVGRSKLAYMTVNYWGFDGYRHRGQLVFRSSHKGEFVAAFTRLYNDHIPLHGMYLVDKFGYSSRVRGANDYASMQHDNTSAFNCRWVVGSPGTMSPHAYGTAVDINPFENPYHSAKGWVPNYWWRAHNFPPYTWRSRSAPAVKDMLQSGFHWTYGNEDAQHFDT